MPPKAKGEKGKKAEKAKDPKKLVVELTKLNEELKIDLDATKATLDTTKQKLLQLALPLMENMKKKWKFVHGVTEGMDLLEVSGDVFREALDDIIVKKKEHEVSVESRVLELESRVTEMSVERVRLTKKCHAYEMAMGDLLHYDNLNAVKDRVYQLQVIAGEAYHSAEANDSTRDPEMIFKMEGITDRFGNDPRRVINSANVLDLQSPATKNCGDTLLKDIVPELGIFIMKELNVDKLSGADWRTLATKIGIQQDQIEEWSSARLKNPAGRVLTAWIDACPAVTVRLLHRHLMSPPLRCTMLCKRLTDFYNII